VTGIVKIALIAGGIWLATKIAAALSLKLTPGSISVSGNAIALDLNILNTSTFPIAYDNFFGNVYVNNQNVGTVYDNTAQQIIGNGITTLQLLFTPLPGTLITDVINFFETGSSAAITIRGHITAENIPIPISETYNTPNLSGAVNQVQNLLTSMGL
jgi:LEA14-like dessication related protein